MSDPQTAPALPRSRWIVSVGLLALLALITLDTLVGSLTEAPPEAPPGAEWVIDGFCLLLFALFAAALWHNTRPRAYSGQPRRTGLLLVLQLLLGVTLSTDLLPLLAAQVPLTLPPRWALRWMALQALARGAAPLEVHLHLPVDLDEVDPARAAA